MTVVVLVGTVIFIAARPHGLNEGLAALLGMIAVLLIGTATPGDVWRAITSTAQVLVFLVAMMLVATIAEDAGCFEWAAERTIALSQHDGRLLFVNLYILGALITVFQSLDVTAIMLAPIVCTLVRRTHLSPLPLWLTGR
ncbi:MAG TPA: SLC13 family permease [Chloroflexota bacterium]|nr:SLC13 family permease [Chloroflexota bacterium]